MSIEINVLYFIYGLCVMFYFIMAWIFVRKNGELLSRLVAALMVVIGLGCIKDMFFLVSGLSSVSFSWSLMTSTDMVAVPLYAFILIELCRPGSLTWRRMLLHEIPFVVLPLLLAVTRNEVFYDIDVAYAAVYGFGYAIWTVVAIPRYHRHLRECFSYEENISLNWLRYILASFFIILSVWIVDCLVVNVGVETVYMTGSLAIWMFICYFIYRHESVIGELSVPRTVPVSTDESMSDLERRIRRFFEDERAFLNPHLKVSDVARAVGTNRTYVSNYFNRQANSTFYDYVNSMRVEYARQLLATGTDSVKCIAEQSGFNSPQAFIRVFTRIEGVTPTKYRGG